MLNFIITPPSEQTLRHYFYPDRDRKIATLVQALQPVLDSSEDPDIRYDYLAKLQSEECDVGQLVEDWLADHLWGGGDIRIDPAWMVMQLDMLIAVGSLPDLDALMTMYLWAWWREHTLLAQVRNQRRGQPLGSSRPRATEWDVTQYPCMPLHHLHGKLPKAAPTDLVSRLHALVAQVHADIENPTWVLWDATQLRARIAAHYEEWHDFLQDAGVEISLDSDSLREARRCLAQPMAPLPSYVGPRYKYGVDFRAGSFLVAHTLALASLLPCENWQD